MMASSDEGGNVVFLVSTTINQHQLMSIRAQPKLDLSCQSRLIDQGAKRVEAIIGQLLRLLCHGDIDLSVEQIQNVQIVRS